MLPTNEEILKENTRLRYLLANGNDPCIYCSLSKADQGKCASGFPGCARADDWLCGICDVDFMPNPA